MRRRHSGVVWEVKSLPLRCLLGPSSIRSRQMFWICIENCQLRTGTWFARAPPRSNAEAAKDAKKDSISLRPSRPLRSSAA